MKRKTILWGTALSLAIALAGAGIVYAGSHKAGEDPVENQLQEMCGKCTGSSYCKACTTCNYCNHCAKRGKSCGVCSSR